MKEMIAEALQENAQRKEELKKQLDWVSLDVRMPRTAKDKQQVKNFRHCHFQSKKP